MTETVSAHEMVHQAIRAFLVTVHEAKVPGDIAGLRELLSAQIPEHFSEEEAPGGFFEHLKTVQDDADSLIADLCQEHKMLLDELADVVWSLDQLDDAALLVRLREFATHLAHHEARETAAASGKTVLPPGTLPDLPDFTGETSP